MGKAAFDRAGEDVEVDFLVIGGGIAGASVAYFLAPYGSVAIAEAEPQPGYHSTGRSAALFCETYGNAAVRALTLASKPFFLEPPAGFCDHALLRPRGTLYIGRADQHTALDDYFRAIAPLSPQARVHEGSFALGMVPVLRAENVSSCIWDAQGADIETHALHVGFLRGARAHGGLVLTDFPIEQVTFASGRWCARSRERTITSRILIDAAGAWADGVAALSGVRELGLVPMRRTAVLVGLAPGVDVSNWPTVVDIDEQFYFKPEAGKLILSPADETPVPAGDIYPDELDVAVAIERVCAAANLDIRRLERSWAGLRTFAADRVPVAGFDPDVCGFFWLAGHGGYGLQTAPALGEFAASLVLGQPIPDHIARLGIRESDLSPVRLRSSYARQPDSVVGSVQTEVKS